MAERLIAACRHAASIGSRLRRRPQTGSSTSPARRAYSGRPDVFGGTSDLRRVSVSPHCRIDRISDAATDGSSLGLTSAPKCSRRRRCRRSSDDGLPAGRRD